MNRTLMMMVVVFCTAMSVVSCGPANSREAHRVAVAGEDASADAVAGEVVPDENILCEIVLERSSVEDVEDILGDAYRRVTTRSTTLLYEYATGLALSLVFVDGVLVDVTVFNGKYPACWLEAQQRRDGELDRQIEQELMHADAGA